MSGLTYDEMRELKPCSDRSSAVTRMLGGKSGWNGKKISAADAVKSGVTFEDLVWAASAKAKTDPDIERRVRLWLADCAAHVLHIYEKDYPTDPRIRDAIIAARQFARGKTMAAAWDTARAAAMAAAWDTAMAAAMAAAWDAAGVAAWAAEEKWQLDRLVAWLSDPEPQDWPLPEAGVK